MSSVFHGATEVGSFYIVSSDMRGRMGDLERWGDVYNGVLLGDRQLVARLRSGGADMMKVAFQRSPGVPP